MRWVSSGRLISDDTTVLYSVGEKHERGVGILLSKEISKAVDSWEPVSDRI